MSNKISKHKNNIEILFDTQNNNREILSFKYTTVTSKDYIQYAYAHYCTEYISLNAIGKLFSQLQRKQMISSIIRS